MEDYMDNEFEENEFDVFNSEENDYYEDSDQSTWGQQRGLCDQFDNCYSCPYASECF